MSEPQHDPGSTEAIKAGCTCDPVKNRFGRGQPGPQGPMFYPAKLCPLHRLSVVTANEEESEPVESLASFDAALRNLRLRRPRGFRR